MPFIQPGSDDLARAVAAALPDADVVLLGHHGCVIVADSFDVGFSRAANLEAAARGFDLAGQALDAARCREALDDL